MNEPDLVPLWAAVPKKQEPSPALLEQVIENTISKPVIPTGIQKRRLLLKDPGSYETIQNWFEYLKKDWLPVIREVGFPPDSEQERTAIFMLMGFITQDTRHIAQITNWPVSKKWLQERRERAKRYYIWMGNGCLKADWLEFAEKQDCTAEVAFALDVMVINGDTHKSRDGYYNMTDKGKLNYDKRNAHPKST